VARGSAGTRPPSCGARPRRARLHEGLRWALLQGRPGLSRSFSPLSPRRLGKTRDLAPPFARCVLDRSWAYTRGFSARPCRACTEPRPSRLRL